MPKHIKKAWPRTVGVRARTWNDEPKKWWAAFEKWKGNRYGPTVSDFVREAIQEKMARIEGKS